jgi:hypothetical protein
MIGCSFLKNIVKQVPSQDIMREQITNACTHTEGITNIIHYLRQFHFHLDRIVVFVFSFYYLCIQ